MATKAKPEPEAPITLSTIETVFKRALEDPERGVPALIGPPQWGKTHYMRRWFQDIGTKHIVMMNPQTDLPEDIAGWPVRQGNELTFTNPSPIPPKFLNKETPPWALGIDEMDKAQDATLSALLTLLNPGERRLRDTYIPTNVPVAVAMNEPNRELPEPLVARLLFIPFPPAGFEMAPKVANSVALTVPQISIPQRPFAPGSYFKLKAWFSCSEFAQDAAVRRAVVSGLFPAAAVPGVLGSLQDNYSITADWAKSCTIEEFLSQVYLVVETAPDAQAAAQILTDLRNRANADRTGEFQRAYAYAFALREEGQHIKLDTNAPADIDEAKAKGIRVMKAFKELAEDFWTEMEGEAKE